jgi:peptidoglycan-N-acetylglucosamine deacetylase
MLRISALSFVVAGSMAFAVRPANPQPKPSASSTPKESAAPAKGADEKTAQEKPPAGKPAEKPVVPVPAKSAQAVGANAQVSFSQCNVEGPYLSITFDDGPHGAFTPRLLKMLKERNIHATFFCVGQCVAEYPEIAKQIVEEGHEIANHSWNHPNLPSLGEGSVRDQIDRTHIVIKQTTGVTPVLFRPPYGAFTNAQKAWANATWGYKCILWDVDTNDWKHHNPAQTQSITLRNSKSGSIILCHDIHKSTVDAMPATLDALLAKGFKFVTVSELLKLHKPGGAKPVPASAKALTVKEGAHAATTLEELKPPAAESAASKP